MWKGASLRSDKQNIKLKYSIPSFELVEFEYSDIITASAECPTHTTPCLWVEDNINNFTGDNLSRF